MTQTQAKTAHTAKIAVVTLVSMAIGLGYFSYINAVDFPLDIVRVVPFIWLAGASAAAWLSGRQLKAQDSKKAILANVALFAVNLASILLALIFCMGALLGD